MGVKATKTIYWILTLLFVLTMLGDSYGGLTKQQQGQDALKHLGYPIYALTIFGIAKLLGALAILQTKFVTIKEWAYAGFVINSLGAAMSHYFVADSIGMIIAPLVLLAYTVLTYYLWKKHAGLLA